MEWVNVTAERPPPDFEGLDPYASWSLGDGLPHFFPEGEAATIFPLLLELEGISAREFADGSGLFDERAALETWRASVFVPAAFLDPAPELDHMRDSLKHVTAFVRGEFFDFLKDKANVRLRNALRSITLSRPISERSLGGMQPAPVSHPERKLPGGSPIPGVVVVGIIDDGIAFAQERFRNGDGTSRVESVWIQDGVPNATSVFSYGREIPKTGPGGLDDLLARCTHGGVVDEDELYDLAGVGDFSRLGHKAVCWRRAHGTHVLDLAAGSKPGEKPTWPIVCVQLPVSVTADTSGASLARWVIDGIWYILLQSLAISARMNSAPLPVAINISYGFIAGPHDGTHTIERAIDHTVELWEKALGAKVRVVIPSGNHHLARVHANIRFQTVNEVVELPWRILPDDGTPSHVEIWLPRRPAKYPCPVAVTVSSPAPNPVSSAPIGASDASVFELKDGAAVLAQVSYEYIRAPTGRGMFRITVRPTIELERHGSGYLPAAPSGTWLITVKNLSVGPSESVDAWIQRDDTPYGYPTIGRQSYFDDPRYRRFDDAGREVLEDDGESVVQRAGTMNAIATGQHAIVIGGVVRADLQPARYSSGGPIPSQHRVGPDALAVSDDSIVRSGVLAAGTHSGSVVAMNGTSVAAPMITRYIAEELARGGRGNRAAVASLAERQEEDLSDHRATQLTGAPARPKPQRGGAGRIRLAPMNNLRMSEDELEWGKRAERQNGTARSALQRVQALGGVNAS
jgi:hypothetical protein